MSQDAEDIAARLAAGHAVSDAEVSVLAATNDILTLGMLGDEARRRRHGADTTFVRVADVNLPLADGADLVIPPAAKEVRVAGALDDFDAVLRGVPRVARAAGAVPVSAFSVEALEACARRTNRPLEALLTALRDAGVMLIAEAALDQMQDAESSLEQVRRAGLGLARLTVHHTARSTARAAHILRARALQASLGGWLPSFAPLGRTWNADAPSTGYDDVRQVALARLLADNIASIQVDWSKYGPKLAQVALTVGADDVDGVSPLDETGEGRRRAPLEEIRRNITAAALVPVERDGAYRRTGA